MVLAAVSGGLDSMCLLHMLYHGGFTVAAAHYNHGLRGREAERDQAFVRRYCQGLGIPFYTEAGDVAALARKAGAGIEETARRARYAFLYRTAAEIGASKIATAHTADDNVETVLMNLTRGAGTNGLAGIPPVRGIVIRPLLAVSRAELIAYAKAHGLSHVEDSTNQTDAYTRNRIRHRVIPELKEINPALCAAVANMTELLRADARYLDGLAADFLKEWSGGEVIRIPAAAMKALALPVKSRVVYQMMEKMGLRPDKAVIGGVLDLLAGGRPSGRLSLGGGWTACREYEDLLFKKETVSKADVTPVQVPINGSVSIPELGLVLECRKVFEKNSEKQNTFLFQSEAICGNITARTRCPGDHIVLSGRNGTKSLKKLFIDEKIPRGVRDRILVLADEAGVIAVQGFGVHRRCRAEAYENGIIKITIEERGT